MTDNAARLHGWLTQALDLWPALPSARREEYDALIERVADLVATEPLHVWRRLPMAIQAVFGGRGYAWNGIYARDGDTLRLFAAAGPPVCASLERSGDRGVGSSGMCFDGLLMNQTLVAARSKDWPGYVSCDGASGLRTVAGIVCPIRNAQGTPIAVWDVDIVQALEPEDGPFFDKLWASLSVLYPPEPAILLAFR